MAAIASQQPPQTLTPLQHQNHAYQHQQVHMYPSQHSIMEDLSDDERSHEDEDEEEMGDDESFEGDIVQHHGGVHHPDQNSFYRQQQQQAIYYQQHKQQHGEGEAGPSRTSPSKGINAQAQDGLEDEDMYSDDDESSTASIPDEDIDFSLTYAL